MSKTTDYVIDEMNKQCDACALDECNKQHSTNNIEHKKQPQNTYNEKTSDILFNKIKAKVLTTKCVVCGDAVISSTNIATCKSCM